MQHIDNLRARFDEEARDIKLNLESVLQPGGALSDAQRWGTAFATVLATRQRELRDAVLADARAAGVSEEVLADARAAAALMAMNNVYYRFRHVVGKESYTQMPARLRMTRLAKPATDKTDFELFSLAVSAVNGCETCMRAHEAVVRGGGLTEDAVHDAVRIAAVIHAAAVALDMVSESPVGEDAAAF
jgi:lipoyl-dependent peroxiredoxin subunit D